MMEQLTPEYALMLSSERMLFILNDCRELLSNMSDNLANATADYLAMEDMMPHIKSEIVVQFIDKGYKRNEAVDRAVASKFYLEKISKLDDLRRHKLELELKYKILLNNIKCLTAIGYLKNSELKAGL